MKCTWCPEEATDLFSPDYTLPCCRSCGIRQHQALERIAQMVRPMKWTAPPGIE